MNNELQIKGNMAVYDVDDKEIGHVKQVVINPKNQEVSHIVISEGFIFTEEKVLDIKHIVSQRDGKLYIDQAGDTLDLPRFEESYFVPHNTDASGEVHPDALGGNEITHYPDPVYYYPPVDAAGFGLGYWGAPSAAYIDADPVDRVTHQNVPEGSLVVREGENVYSNDGDHVGEVDSVHTTKDTHRVTHFVISQGLLFPDHKLIPMFWVEGVDDEGVRLAVSTKQLEQLPSFDPSKH